MIVDAPASALWISETHVFTAEGLTFPTGTSAQRGATWDRYTDRFDSLVVSARPSRPDTHRAATVPTVTRPAGGATYPQTDLECSVDVAKAEASRFVEKPRFRVVLPSRGWYLTSYVSYFVIVAVVVSPLWCRE
ncbi:hypothetical protein AB0P16_11660 [Dietzia maris]|uniref:hypothetical protein n=1 Tax=Dietzia TaxID=37914 RepID=UPI0020B12057|nr:hypothetical protein [Dietzia sp. WMMA184]